MIDYTDKSMVPLGSIPALPEGVISNDDVRNIVGFAGYIFNDLLNLSGGGGTYLARHRWYDPELGRWLERDPAGYVDGMSLYLYALSNPLLFIDPLGLDGWFDDWFGGSDSIMGGFVTGLGHGAAIVGNAATGGLIPSLNNYVGELKSDYGTSYVVADYSAQGGAMFLQTVTGTKAAATGAKAAQGATKIVVQGGTAAAQPALSTAVVTSSTVAATSTVAAASNGADIVTDVANSQGSRGHKSQIDRSVHRQEKEAFWKEEAAAHPDKYSPENLERMQHGKAPIGKDGHPMEIHHVDGTMEGPKVPMERTDHRLGENYKKNHPWLDPCNNPQGSSGIPGGS